MDFNDLDVLSTDDEANNTVFRDVIMIALLGFVAAVIILLPHLNPPTKAEEIKSPGHIIVEIQWGDGVDADVDLWVKAPHDVPVGYSNKGSSIFNLVRDDLGLGGDPLPLNYEHAFSRGTPEGEYIINLHMYRNRASEWPIAVRTVVSIRRGEREPIRVLFSGETNLTRLGEEVTVVRFTLDEDGYVVPGSRHNIFRSIRSKSSGEQ